MRPSLFLESSSSELHIKGPYEIFFPPDLSLFLPFFSPSLSPSGGGDDELSGASAKPSVEFRFFSRQSERRGGGKSAVPEHRGPGIHFFPLFCFVADKIRRSSGKISSSLICLDFASGLKSHLCPFCFLSFLFLFLFFGREEEGGERTFACHDMSFQNSEREKKNIFSKSDIHCNGKYHKK